MDIGKTEKNNFLLQNEVVCFRLIWDSFCQFLLATFKSKKKDTLTNILTNLKILSRSLFILIIILKTINFHKNHLKKPQTNIITRINIFVVINQVNKHKAKTYNNCVYTHNYYKKFLLFFFMEYKNEWK